METSNWIGIQLWQLMSERMSSFRVRPYLGWAVLFTFWFSLAGVVSGVISGFWISTIIIAEILAIFAWKIYVDNRKLPFPPRALLRVLAASLITWLPIGVVLFPGIALSKWVDGKIQVGLDYAEYRAKDQEARIEVDWELVEDERELWPPSEWIKDDPQLIQFEREIPEIKRSSTEKALFSSLCGLLRCLQFLHYLTVSFVIIRSFGFILSRVSIRQSGETAFTLPKES